MKRLFIIAALIALASTAYAQPRAVFMGDSIFDSWDSKKYGGHPEFFSKNNFVNCGKSGQVTAQMVERFERDVIARNPECVIICGGTNDIAQNKGYAPNRLIMKNIKTMARMRFIDNKSWEYIGSVTNYDRSVCYRKVKKYIEGMDI